MNLFRLATQIPLLVLLLFPSLQALAQQQGMVLLSQSLTGGATGNDHSDDPSISANGRYLAFVSRATDLVAATDANGTEDDVFIRDLLTGTTTLASRALLGNSTGNALSDLSNAQARVTNLSDDGRYLVYRSRATDITADADGNGESDVFRFDQVSNQNLLLSRALSGGTGNDSSSAAQLSADGSVAVFSSSATNLTAETDSNSANDVFFWDGVSLTLVSRAVGGDAGNDGSSTALISADGNWVAFRSDASDLTADADNNGDDADLFLWSRQDNSLRLINRATGGGSSNDSVSSTFGISADGRWVAFESGATDLTLDTSNNGGGDVFLYDRINDSIILISQSTGGGTGNDASGRPLISRDGNWVVFSSEASDLTSNTDTNTVGDVFLYSRQSDTITLISKTPGGAAGNASSGRTGISGDGRFVAFRSTADDLTADVDGNGTTDMFVYDRDSDDLTFATLSTVTGLATSGDCDDLRMSVNGLVAAAECEAPDLTGDTNSNGSGTGGEDVYAFTDLATLARAQNVNASVPLLSPLALLLLVVSIGWLGIKRRRAC